jgi:exopolysaccharide production protein ExoQ
MSSLPLLVFIIALIWLYYQDVKDRQRVTRATWIVAMWAVTYGSRPVTEWFGQSRGGGVVSESVDEGNPTEALISLSFMLIGCIVLLRRNIRWGTVLKENAVVVVFYMFWWLSLLWSDYPFITFKRLFKELGTIIMALVVLTDLAPEEAIRAICVRVSYLCIPLSVILIRYFPEWGRAYGGYDKSEVMWVGVADHKNTLGVLAMVGAVFLLWDVLESWRKGTRRIPWSLLAPRVLTLGLCWYILFIANSVTSLLCAALGSALLVVLNLTGMRKRPGRLELFGGGVVAVILILDALIGFKEDFLEAVGRDPTLTTRTEIWPMLMQLQPNAMVGAGFNTFWAGERLRISFEKFGGIFQAHNGYLEIYLSGGWIGIAILAGVLFAAYLQIRKRLAVGAPEAGIRLVVLVIAVVYNYSEASFNKIGVLWLLTIIAIMQILPASASLQADARARR